MDIGKQIDGQSLTQAFSFTRAKEKAFHGLRGILAGIVADRTLNEKELLFLDAWLQSQQHLSSDPDALNILSRVGDILELGQIRPEDLRQMQFDIERIITSVETETPKIEAQIDELMGFLSGVASDGLLNDTEIKALATWLERHKAVRNSWPASVIIERLDNILEDGLITEEERRDLLNKLQKITGYPTPGTSLRVEHSTEVWEDTIEDLSLKDTTFCLTGDFVSGDRNTVETMLRLKGGQISTNVNKAVDFLVIGTLASRNWLYTSHGRKIEKALLLKRQGVAIKIITERTLLKFLRR